MNTNLPSGAHGVGHLQIQVEFVFYQFIYDALEFWFISHEFVGFVQDVVTYTDLETRDN